MKKTIYTCDICGTEIKKDDVQFIHCERRIYWGKLFFHGKREWYDIDEVCDECWEKLMKAWDRVREENKKV
ncbi:MAG: hypothetical protein J6P07_04780 [Spirochaetaceae bacterium]|nr:hypothetical protein [Spirochaetaceae bacterium]MBO7731552.1 hypothetical protein [Methanobrevibacter sp.]